MAETITLRPLLGKILSIATAGVIVVCLSALIVQDQPAALLRYTLPLVTLGYLVWMAFWAPDLEISDGGVRMRNVFHTVTLAWPAIERIDTKYALTLYTRYGRFVAWVAPAAGRHQMLRSHTEDLRGLPESTFMAGTVGLGDMPNSVSGDAAAIIRRRWDGLRDAGHLDAPVLDPDLHPSLLHRGRIAVLAALLAASAVCFIVF